MIKFEKGDRRDYEVGELVKGDRRDYEVGELVMVVDDTYKNAPHKMDMFSVCRINYKNKHSVRENARRRVFVLNGNYENEFRWVATEDVVPINIMMEIVEEEKELDFKVGDFVKGNTYRNENIKLAKVIETSSPSMRVRILDHPCSSLIGDIIEARNLKYIYKKVEIN